MCMQIKYNKAIQLKTLLFYLLEPRGNRMLKSFDVRNMMTEHKQVGSAPTPPHVTSYARGVAMFGQSSRQLGDQKILIPESDVQLFSQGQLHCAN